jgi:hypothetical protein
MSRILKAGTLICLAGSALPVALAKDAELVQSEIDGDEAFVGRLIRNDANFQLNIGSVEGVWNPVTGAREVEEEKRQAEEAAASKKEEEAAEEVAPARKRKRPLKRSRQQERGRGR